MSPAAVVNAPTLRFPGEWVATLSQGGWGNPDVYLIRAAGELRVVKDFGPRSTWVRVLFGRWLIRRELRVYERLAGIPAVPAILEVLDPLAIAIEYRPGEVLGRHLADSLPREFLAEFRSAIDAMHGRGVVHLDLRHRSNVLAGEDGHPVLIDFASALRFPRWAAGLAHWLGAVDRWAFSKWEERLGRSLCPRTPRNRPPGSA